MPCTTAPCRLQLVGALIGLAIYNSVLLDVHFPLALYKKLQGLPVGLDDLEELAPTVAKSLRALLDYKGACKRAGAVCMHVRWGSVGRWAVTLAAFLACR